jgi:hypothetical protein
MNVTTIDSESLQRVIALWDLPDVVIQVCGKDFLINQSILPIFSTKLEEYFSEFDDPFPICLNDEDKSNSLFESVSCESLIENFSIFVSFFENGTVSTESILHLHLPSLILLSKKLFSEFIFSSIIPLLNICDKSSTSKPSFDSSNSFLKFYSHFESNYNDDKDNEFSFKVCSKVYKCSFVSAAIFSKRAFTVLKNENQFCIEIECPADIRRSRFEKEFENVFKMIFGFPLLLNKEKIEIILSISSQIENSNVYNCCIEFIKTNDLSNLETTLLILSNSELLSKEFDLHSIISKVSEDFENVSKERLSNIPPSGISKIIECRKLKLKSEDSLFEFLFEYSKKWNELSIPLFSKVYFEYLNETNLSKFF